MPSVRKFFANLFHASKKERSHQLVTQSTESLPPTIDNTRVATPFKNVNPAALNRSLPTTLDDWPQIPQARAQDPEELAPGGSTSRVSGQFMDTNPASSRQSLSSILKPSSPPWESWKIDGDFLLQVYDWNAKHPQNTLDRILNKTSTLIDRHGILLELVPDGPIPFRGFVKALAHVVKLGTAIAEAKVAALQFAADVLQWLEKLSSAFGDGGSSRFISKAWDNLGDIRGLIEDVCTWAHRMLNGGLIQRASVNEKIVEFQKEFTHAIERFGVISNIRIAIGQDRLNRRLDSLGTHIAVGQDYTNRRLDSMNEHLTQMGQKPEQTLPDATFQSQKKIPCDPGSRRTVLAEIMRWIDNISEGSQSFLWLSGDPGVGKSAVTASIARECIRRKILWAQFFINRNDAMTVDPRIYFPSIAEQMSLCAPAVKHAVQKKLEEHPYLMTDDISLEQATKLFIDTIRVASASTPTQPVAIVIDALDETDLKRLKDTAEIFSQVVRDLPPNAKVFISSRVESVIRDNFAHHPRVQNIHLSVKNSIADVTEFLERKVHEIMKEHHIDWAQWGEEPMQKLCSQASGLFIWAVTAIDYIRVQIEDFGTECLHSVIDELNTNGMDKINMLYRAILQRTYQRIDQHPINPWQIQCFRRIMGAILAQQSPLSVDDLTALLDLRNPTTGAAVDVKHFVRRLRTVLVPGVANINGRTVPRVHKSFADFVTSAEAQDFRVDMTDSHGELALRCIDHLTRLWKGQVPRQVHYATLHWSSHLTRLVGVPLEQEEADDDTATSNDAKSIVSNLENDANVPASVEPRQTDSKDQRLIADDNTHDDLWNASVSLYTGRVVCVRRRSLWLRDLETGEGIGVTPEGHTDDINSAVFSPDGRFILSASDDKTIRTWDSSTGQMLNIFEGHTRAVLAAIFSPDGKHIVSASFDKTIRTWDSSTGETLNIFKGHTGGAYTATFSPDGRHIVSASYDRTIRVWDAKTGEVVHVLEGHPSGVCYAVFSPDGKNILSCSKDGTIIVWDSEAGERIPDASITSGSPNAELSFTSSETRPYIVTPPKSITVPGTTPAAYSFDVGEGRTGGIGNAWVYSNQRHNFVTSMYLDQLIFLDSAPAEGSEEGSEDAWAELKPYLEAQIESIVYAIQSVLSGVRSPTPSPALNENLTQIITIVSAIVAVCNDNLPPASVQQGNEILCELSDHATKLSEVQALPEVTKESRQIMAKSSFAIANVMKGLMKL